MSDDKILEIVNAAVQAAIGGGRHMTVEEANAAMASMQEAHKQAREANEARYGVIMNIAKRTPVERVVYHATWIARLHGTESPKGLVELKAHIFFLKAALESLESAGEE